MCRDRYKAWQCHFHQSWKGQNEDEKARRGDKQKNDFFDDEDDDKKDFPK